MRKAFSGHAGLSAAVLTLAAAFVSLGTQKSQAIDFKTLTGHVPPAIHLFHLQPLQNLPSTSRLNLAVSLPLRNQQGLDVLLQQIYDPASPKFHHYLTPEQFTEQFGPSQQDYDAVVAFLKASGLTVTTHSDRTLVDASGDTAAINRAFHVTLQVYQHPTENRTFYAPDTDPVINLGLPISHITGLDNFFIPRPMAKIRHRNASSSGAQPAGTGSEGGEFMGNDFRAAYCPGVTLNGAGQTVALFELDGYYSSDITAYEQTAGLPSTTLTNVSVNGGVSSPGSGDGEVSLDIEMAISMATNLSRVMVYEAPNGGNNSVPDLLSRIASDNLAKQISSSWLIGDNSSYDTYYQKMAAQGQTFLQASGDDDAYYSGISEWADDTNITLVGGTTLTTTGPSGSYVSETTWQWGYDSNAGTDVGSGGGTNFNGVPIPPYQQGVSMANNQGSTTLRNVPDVALTGDNIYVAYNNGGSGDFGGTSCAAPLWAAFIALVNQQALVQGGATVGFINPAIYAIGKSANYTNDFNDVTTGNNTNANVLNEWYATSGYDLCTGWGTPNGQNMINALAPPTQLPFNMTPSAGFNAVGYAGGPFTPGSQVYVLTNSTSSPVKWALMNYAPWLNVSATGGTLATNSATNVTINVNASANSLPVGIYSASVTFTNSTTSTPNNLAFTLQINEPLAVTPAAGLAASGAEGGPFSPGSQVYSLTNQGAAPLNWSLVNTSSWLSASATSGTLAADGAASVTISLNAQADNLAAGVYGATIVFADSTSGDAESFTNTLQVAEPLVITPGAGFAASLAVEGGPVTAASQTFFLTNTGSVSLTWQGTVPAWLNLSPSGGTLAGSAGQAVTVALNPNAANFTTGTYTGQASFTDENSGNVQQRQFSLSIGQNIVQNSGFETGDFTDWTFLGTANRFGTLYNGVVSVATQGSEAADFVHSGTYGAALGYTRYAYLYQSLATIPGQSYLLSFWLSNPGGSTPNQFLVDWNTNATGTNTIFSQSNIGDFDNWTNLMFVLTATGTNTTIVFGCRNNNFYFGLDDVNVWPVPLPTIRGFSKVANQNLSLTWNALTNVTYEVEYATNIASTNWLILSTNVATGPTLTVTNLVSPNPQMYYRTVRLP